MSKRDLLEKLQDPDYRNEFVSSEIDVGLPMQIRAMREKRQWSQSFVAEKTGTKQPRFSLMEKPGYGSFSLSTLKKLAALFDVGLIVSFVPWGEMIDFVQSLSSRRLDIVPFSEEARRLERSYSRDRRQNTPIGQSQQLSFAFPIGGVATFTAPISATAVSYEQTSQTEGASQIPQELIAAAHLATINQGGNGVYVNTR